MNKPLPVLNIQQWVEENRHLLKPPVGNQQLFIQPDSDFIIMLVGGPNSRTDYHLNAGEEFFYQLEGEITLRLQLDGQAVAQPIKAGEMFLLPANIPHRPERPSGTVGLVIERRRTHIEKDGFLWFCEACNHPLHQEHEHVTDIVSQLPPIMARYRNNPALKVCKNCGYINP